MNQVQLRLADAAVTPQPDRHVSLGRHLIQTGTIAPWQLFFALERQSRWDATLGEILLSQGWVTYDQLLDAYAVHYGVQRIDLNQRPPDTRLSDRLDPGFCLKHALLPWRELGGRVILATSRPDRIDRLRPALPASLRHAPIVIADESQLLANIARTHRSHLVPKAESRVSEAESCRSWGTRPEARLWFTLSALIFLAGLFLLAPRALMGTLMLWALLTLAFAGALKYTAFLAFRHRQRHRSD